MVEYEFIPEYDEDNFMEYYKRVKVDFKNIKNEFPLLNITSLPTRNSKEVYIYGSLINKDILKLCKKEIDIKRNSIYILGIYPSDFPRSEIVIEDLRGKIKWNEIPNKHIHISSYKNKRQVLCTHHPNGEINEFPMEERSIEVLNSAWRLYMQYKEYVRTGRWVLNDLPHGIKAYDKLKKEKKFYKK